MNLSIRITKTGLTLLATLLCLGLASAFAASACTQAFAQTDDLYKSLAEDFMTTKNTSGLYYRHGDLSVTSADATASDQEGIDGVITVEVGGTATVTLSPYQHLQWHGCRIWLNPRNKKLLYCPVTCDSFITDGCFYIGKGCMCNNDPSLETIELTTTIADESVLSVSGVSTSNEIVIEQDNVGQTNTGTLTLTGLADGATTITVAADGLYFWWPCTKTYQVVVGAGGSADPEPALVGDVNDSGAINVVDAQIVIDMANGKWTESAPFDKLVAALDNGWTAATAAKAADMNADGKVDATDARAIQARAIAS